MKKGTKLTSIKLAKAEIIQEMIDMRIKEGYATHNIVKEIQSKYGFSTSGIYAYWKEARELMGKTYQEMNTNALIDSIFLMETMMQNCIAAGDMKMALDIQKELNKCNQLHIKKVELDTKGEPIIINIT